MGTHMQTHHINKDSHCKKKIEREGTCKRVEGFFCCFFTCQAPPSLCFICYFFYVLLNGFWFDWATIHMIFSKIVHSQLLRCFLKLNCKHNAETDWHWNRQSDGSVEHRQDKLRLQRKKPAKQTSTLNKKLCWRSRHHHHFFEDCIQAGRVHTRRVFLHISLAFFQFWCGFDLCGFFVLATLTSSYCAWFSRGIDFLAFFFGFFKHPPWARGVFTRIRQQGKKTLSVCLCMPACLPVCLFRPFWRSLWLFRLGVPLSLSAAALWRTTPTVVCNGWPSAHPPPSLPSRHLSLGTAVPTPASTGQPAPRGTAVGGEACRRLPRR